ncbi:MAG: GNAT family N-acetyltransferase [Candidatus Obscuribacterales bacterium]|nr:GNAT family N-acetyltransferase [Candidatus Obscuribacterales bacterium]
MKNDSMNHSIARENYASSDVLRDGRTLHIRSIRADDKRLLQESWQALSKQSQYFRFFSPKDKLTEADLLYFTEVDLVNHVGLGASIVSDDAEVPVGVGRYIRSDVGSNAGAELAFVVGEQYQGLGIATILLRHLVLIAREQAITEFTAFVLPENTGMQIVLHKSGLPMKQVINSAGVLEITLSLT